VTLLNEFKRDERGVTAIEYGLIGVAMAVALAAVLATGDDSAFLQQLTDAFTGIGETIADATPTSE
jgi:pilus assembly protein Flp/PilA